MLETSPGDDPSASPVVPFLVRPDRSRQRVPIASMMRQTATTAWGLDGDVLLAMAGDLSVWSWTEHDDEPTLLRPASALDERLLLSVAPDSRYARTKSSDTIDVPSYTSTVYDLLDGTPLYSHSGCGEATSFFGWEGDGPNAVVLGNTCDGLGEVTSYQLVHSTPEQSARLFEFTPDDVPELAMVRQGGLLYLDYETRWQLYDLAARRIVAEQPAAGSASLVNWSPDGRSLYRVAGPTLQRIDAAGVERWSLDLGIQPISMSPSPAGDRLVVMSGDCGGGSCIGLVDAEDGSARFFHEPGGAQISWAPHGDAIIVSGRRDPTIEWGTEGLDWMDVETGEAHFLAAACNPPMWSPDGEIVVCMEPCLDRGDELERPRLFDAAGVAFAEGACDRYSSLPAWSPDSDVLAITVTGADERERVLLIDREGRSHAFVPGSVSLADWRPGPVR